MPTPINPAINDVDLAQIPAEFQQYFQPEAQPAPAAPTAPPSMETGGTPNDDAGVKDAIRGTTSESGGGGAPRPPAAPPPGPPGPPPPSVPVPPPPVQFNIGGTGGGTGASSFARPGSAAARPFRSMDFVNSRVRGGSPMDMNRRVGFGAGSAVIGGQGAAGAAPGGGDFNAQSGPSGGVSEEEIARILAQVAGKYTGGQ